MDIQSRIKLFLKLRDVKVSIFERKINSSNGYVKSLKKSIGNDKLERIVEHYPELNIEWLLLGKGEMLKNSAQDSALVNEPETPYTNTSAKLEEARERILTLQEKLIDARDALLDNDKELTDYKNNFIASQKTILELEQRHAALNEKYNALKESILSKNINNVITDSKFFDQTQYTDNQLQKKL